MAEGERGDMNYAYNEDRMLEGIRAFREEQKRQIREAELMSVVTVSRKAGCQIHGTTNLYFRHPRNRKSYYTCRICQGAFSRRYYLKNREKIVLKKREYYRKSAGHQLKQAA